MKIRILHKLSERGLHPKLIFAQNEADFCRQVDGLLNALIYTEDTDARRNIVSTLRNYIPTEAEVIKAYELDEIVADKRFDK